MIENIKETISVPASFLVDGFKELPIEVQEKIVALSVKRNTTEIPQSEIDEIVGLLPEKMKEGLTGIGAELPSDQVDLTIRLGEFLYHVFVFNAPVPQAPLAAKRHEKRLMELAEVFDKDQIEAPQDVLETIERVMNDPNAWAKSQFGASLTVEGGSKYIVLSAAGVGFFKKIINASVGLFQ